MPGFGLTSFIVPQGTAFRLGAEARGSPFLNALNQPVHQATEASLVHRNSVPSHHIRCMITARRRASATTAFLLPHRWATLMAQAFSHDHRVVCRNIV